MRSMTAMKVTMPHGIYHSFQQLGCSFSAVQPGSRIFCFCQSLSAPCVWIATCVVRFWPYISTSSFAQSTVLMLAVHITMRCLENRRYQVLFCVNYVYALVVMCTHLLVSILQPLLRYLIRQCFAKKLVLTAWWGKFDVSNSRGRKSSCQ